MSNLSRKWQGHLWIKDYINYEIEHVDVGVTVYHTPNQTLRVFGRFSNGLQTADITFSLTIFAEVSNGEVYILQIYERVPATGLGGTQVNFKDDHMMLPGEILSVRAFAGVISNSPSVSIKVKYDIEDKELSLVDGTFKDKPSGVKFQIGLILDELSKSNVCEMVQTSFTETPEWIAGTRCDPSSGETEKYKIIKDRPTPLPGKKPH